MEAYHKNHQLEQPKSNRTPGIGRSFHHDIKDRSTSNHQNHVFSHSFVVSGSESMNCSTHKFKPDLKCSKCNPKINSDKRPIINLNERSIEIYKREVALPDQSLDIELKNKLVKLEGKVRSIEKDFNSNITTTLKTKSDEIEACFNKLQEELNRSKTELLSKIKSYFHSVQKNFQASKAEIEAQIASLSFTSQSKMSSDQISAFKEKIYTLKNHIKTKILINGPEITNLRIAFNRNLIEKVGGFCKLINSGEEMSDQKWTTAEEFNNQSFGQENLKYIKNETVLNNLLMTMGKSEEENKNVSNYKNIQLIGLNSQPIEKKLKISEFQSDPSTKPATLIKKSTQKSSFLESKMDVSLLTPKNKFDKHSTSKMEINLGQKISFSPVQNGFRNLLGLLNKESHSGIQKTETSVQKTVPSKNKDERLELIYAALRENSTILDLSGTGVDYQFLSENKTEFYKLKKIRLLYLNNNKISDVGFLVLGSILTKIDVEVISLQNNQLSTSVLTTVADICIKKPKTKTIYLNGNNVYQSEIQRKDLETRFLLDKGIRINL